MKQILFVDDKPAIGKVLSVYLGKENELVYFEDPVRAIEWLNEGNEPALIISDIRMPKMTGSEFLAYLKSNSLFKDIPAGSNRRLLRTQWRRSKSYRYLYFRWRKE